MPVVDDIKELKAFRDTMKGQFAKLHTAQENDERYYSLQFEDNLNLPTQFVDDAIVLPTAREVVDNAADHIMPRFRRVEVPRRNVGEAGTKQALVLKRFYEALLTWLERQSPVSPFRESAKQLPAYGNLIAKFVVDNTRIGLEPVREGGESDDEFDERRKEWQELRKLNMPFTLSIINPLEVMFDPFHDPPMWVIEVTKKFVYDLKRTYPEWANPKNRKPHDTADVVEYWDDDHFTVMIDDASAFGPEKEFMPNEAGFHPYIILGSGLGIDASDHSPEKRYVSLIRHIKGVLESESRNYSMQDIIIKAGAWPIRIATGERTNEMPDIKLEFGQIQPMPPGMEISELTPQLPPAMVFNAMTLANGIISNAASPRVLRGLSSPGTESGFDRQLQLGEARLKFGSLEQAMNQFLTQICIMAGRYMEKVVKHPVSVAAGATQDEFVDVTGRTFNGHHAVSVTINVLEPEDEVRKQQNAASLVNAGLMSPQTALTQFFPNVDPRTELARIVAARVLFSQEVLGIVSQATAQQLVEKLGLEGILEQIITQQTAEGRNPARAGRDVPAEASSPPTAGSPSDQAANRTLDLRNLGG